MTTSKSKILKIILFAYYWLTLGFFVGTVTLLGPVQWLVGWVRLRGWSQGLEDFIVRGVIVLLVLTCAVAAWKLTKIFFTFRGVFARLAIPLVIVLLASGSVWFWLNPPANLRSWNHEISEELHFTFGPYPTREDLIELKREGYTAVISLLHPAVFPFEPILIENEEKMAKEVGIRLIQIPMLPWVSKNESAVKKFKEIVATGEGRYYVHCFLGTDRVHLIKKIIDETNR